MKIDTSYNALLKIIDSVNLPHEQKKALEVCVIAYGDLRVLEALNALKETK